MKRNTPQQVSSLQQTLPNVRNICILAHVDHGKTTLADALVASNGIISQRMAGKMRYMDSREDEQIRGITMKSSAISLLYNNDDKDYLINLIDSPGHVDFSSEVSTAVRLCDGALLMVDVVEGVCPQTHAVLRQAWLENIKPVLVLNKIDRLITELKFSSTEAYIHLQQILEQVNLLTNELYTSEAMGKTSAVADEWSESISGDAQSYDWTKLEDEEEDKNIFFSPDRGNVIFASALDSWGFTISHFAEMYSKKLGFSKNVLTKTIWGDYYVNMKTKSIQKGAQFKGKKPLFVQLVLDNIWSVYDAIFIKRDKDMIEKIQKTLSLKIAPRDACHNDARVQLQAHTSQWLPISKAVLSIVCDILPSPLQISEERTEKLMCNQAQRFDSLPKETQALKSDFLACNCGDDSPVIVFVSKMFPVDRKILPQNRQRPLTKEELQARREKAVQRHAERMSKLKLDEESINGTPIQDVNDTGQEEEHNDDDQVFIAFARIYSGTIKRGQTLYILGPKHNPATASYDIDPALSLKDLSSNQHITSFTVNNLYLFMGRELELMEEIPAGNILGIGGLEDHILKSATISSTIYCPAFTSMYFDALPIVRVAIEPKQASNMKAVTDGLKLLNQADPCVIVSVQETGEHVIITAGEVHLQRCIDDLQERYAKVEVSVSKPIVPFRETVTLPPKVDMVNEAIIDQNQPTKSNRLKQFEDDDEVKGEGIVEIFTPDKTCLIRIHCVPLPKAITELLVEHSDLLKALHKTSKTDDTENVLNSTAVQNLIDFKSKIENSFNQEHKSWKGACNQIWSFGPKKTGPNILLNRIPDYNRPSVWSCLDPATNSQTTFQDLDSCIINGFQMATFAGPMCEEPMHGVCFIIEKWEYLNSTSNRQVDDRCESSAAIPRKREVYGPLSGQIMSIVKDGCRKSFETQPQRLVAAMYKCEIQATADVLGKLYEVLGKRNGRVLSEEMKEGTQLFIVEATLPVVESFGFADIMRKRTSGLASPQLKFSHWEIIDVDPYWVPTTEEEYLHFGEKADSQNCALTYMNNVRKRKGLKVEEKMVEHGEKQRTLTRNK
ncbi:elongation factor-like GTPase 1 isoform X1 [Patella vulgata]|uniref:elongation factor-like GTPase 1 isoform X1 n=1 Tax=Patella vulgata TaxID=6465 RepID=UPI00217F2CFF|nr:elongation factor-like GTPase 1 isoform X1 [Patella vulgata]